LGLPAGLAYGLSMDLTKMPAISATLGSTHADRTRQRDTITVFLCGDVMTGRGIDQILPFPCDPKIYEPYVQSATEYVALAERLHGPIEKPVDFSYVWGDALDEFERRRPHVRIVNLETAVTRRDSFIGKGINYRMSPENVACITAAEIDCCVLANNHVLDWGYGGLLDTLDILHSANIKIAGAGRTIAEAEAPAIIDVPGRGRVIVFAFGSGSSGVPRNWAAGEDRPGINFLEDLSDRTVDRVRASVRRVKRSGDVVVASIHWGGNWGYDVPREQTEFAHKLIDKAAVDIVHGHSSHHARAIEIHAGKPILYGCGDFLNDYEGIGGYEAFRDDLALMYFLAVRPHDGQLADLTMVPLQIKQFRLNDASPGDVAWLGRVLNREGATFGTGVAQNEDGSLQLIIR